MNKYTTQKSYNNAPIIEAIIDISVVYEKNDISSDLKTFQNHIKNDYPIAHDIDTTEIQLGSNNTKINKENIGLKFISADNKYILQIGKRGFTFSMMGNYTNWDEFSDKAKNLWTSYSEKLKPVKTNRVAVRYINRIDIPSAHEIKLEDYFLTYPTLLKGESVSLNGFFLQAQIPQQQGGMAIINQTITHAPNAGIVSILFDIDVFDSKEFDPNATDLWVKLNQLREQKNYLFEKSITDKTKRLFI